MINKHSKLNSLGARENPSWAVDLKINNYNN